MGLVYALLPESWAVAVSCCIHGCSHSCEPAKRDMLRAGCVCGIAGGAACSGQAACTKLRTAFSFASARSGSVLGDRGAVRVELPRSWADEMQEMFDRRRERQLPPNPRGELDAAALASLQREIARELGSARLRAHLTQEQVAAYMGTTKSVVCRLESHSAHMPSTATLLRFARAVGCTVTIRLIPYVQPPPPPAVSVLDSFDWDAVDRR